MKKNEIFYSLSIEDIQTVANDLLNRELSKSEITKLIEPISNKISWYDAIESAILENINESKK